MEMSEVDRRMWQLAYCAALSGLLAAGQTACQATCKEAAALADYSLEFWQATKKSE